MKRNKLAFIALVSALILLTAGCGGGGTDYALECNIDTEQYGFSIAGEDGPIIIQTQGESTSSEYFDGSMTEITIEVNRTLTFEDSNNSYDIVGDIHVDFLAEIVEYDITATGDTFAEPQTCKK